MINLIDQQKAEGNLEKHIRSIHSTAALPSVEYKAFDFHAECPGLKWDRLANLVSELQACQSRFGYYHEVREIGIMELSVVDSVKLRC